jgi:hypothetical protein
VTSVAGEAAATAAAPRFTDNAAARAFEFEIDHSAVLVALAAGHFKQPAIEHDRFVHYLKVDGRPMKVVTGPDRENPGETAIITLVLLKLDRPT